MKFSPTAVAGAYLVTLEPRSDERGFFARTWCIDEFASVGLNGRMVQSSLSRNSRAGTLRGLHFSAAPSEEGALRLKTVAQSMAYMAIDNASRSPLQMREKSGVLVSMFRKSSRAATKDP